MWVLLTAKNLNDRLCNWMHNRELNMFPEYKAYGWFYELID